MSTDGTTQTDPTQVSAEPTTTETSSSTGEGTVGPAEPTGPGFVTRHGVTIITLMVAVIVAALAIAGVAVYRNGVDRSNSDTEAAFAARVAQQGATLETVECSGDTCAAVINGQAYTVLVQKDDQGNQHFGVSSYVGD
jgi:hypothetical protein